ncbi:MAG TPA: hypothetical protein PLL18_16455, partial [Flavobacteriales bacterium]|nr:hypothetical protein [Flavobacteriales bacterium]
LDLGGLVAKDIDPAFTKPLLGSLTAPEAHVPIDRTMPRVLVKGSEHNLGQPMGNAPLALALKEELTTRGFRAVDRAADADLIVDLTADTREMGESNGFYTAALNTSVKVTDQRTGEVVHEGGKQGLKGIQLSYAKAGLDAYKKAAVDLRNELVPNLIGTIFQ